MNMIAPKSISGAVGATYASTATSYQYYSPGVGGAGTIHTNIPTSSTVTIMQSPLVIEYNGTKIDVGQAITMLTERFLVLMPNFEKHEKYQALKNAYDHYKLIESMIKDEPNSR